jgi:hypothetical protein
MLEKVARDSNKAERWVAAEIRGGAEGSSMRLRGAGCEPQNQHHYNRLSPPR